MRITIVCDEFTLEDVTALGQYLRDRYKGEAREVSVFVESREVPAEEAVAALREIFGGDPKWMHIVPLEGNGDH